MKKPLIKQEKIDNLQNLFFEGKKKRIAENQSYVVDYGQALSTKPYSNTLTSVARLASIDQVCGCLYFNQKSELYFSTNSPKTPEIIPTRTGGFSPFKDSFERNIKPSIEELIINNFSEKARLKFLRSSYLPIVKKINRHLNTFKLKEKINCDLNDHISLAEKEIANLVMNEIILVDDWSEKDLDSIESLNVRIRKFLSENFEKDFSYGKEIIEEDVRFYFAIENLAIILSDFIEVSNLHEKKEDYKDLLIKILGKNINLQRARCHGDKGVHCECRMLEHICREVDNSSISVDGLRVIGEAIKEKKFTISKFCCWWCNKIFHALEKISRENNITLQSSLLGNSCAFFPGWKSPIFEDGKLFNALFKEIDDSLESIKEDNLLTIIDRINIENSEVISLYEEAIRGII